MAGVSVKIMKYPIVLLMLLLTSSGCSLAKPHGDFYSIYCSVNINSDNWFFSNKCINRTNTEKPSDYIIAKDELCLRTQTTRSSSVAVHIIDPIRWNPEELNKLLKEHPELIEYFPDHDSPNKGVAWIKNDR
jgi:hypothetical protein